MTLLFRMLSKALASLALAFAILAVVAVPNTARADPISCEDQCALCNELDKMNCMLYCQGGVPGGPKCREDAIAGKCPDVYDPYDNYIGCLNPGGYCFVPGSGAGSCKDNQTNSGCTCLIGK